MCSARCWLFTKYDLRLSGSHASGAYLALWYALGALLLLPLVAGLTRILKVDPSLVLLPVSFSHLNSARFTTRLYLGFQNGHLGDPVLPGRQLGLEVLALCRAGLPAGPNGLSSGIGPYQRSPSPSSMEFNGQVTRWVVKQYGSESPSSQSQRPGHVGASCHAGVTSGASTASRSRSINPPGWRSSACVPHRCSSASSACCKSARFIFRLSELVRTIELVRTTRQTHNSPAARAGESLGASVPRR